MIKKTLLLAITTMMLGACASEPGSRISRITSGRTAPGAIVSGPTRDQIIRQQEIEAGEHRAQIAARDDFFTGVQKGTSAVRDVFGTGVGIVRLFNGR